MRQQPKVKDAAGDEIRSLFKKLLSQIGSSFIIKYLNLLYEQAINYNSLNSDIETLLNHYSVKTHDQSNLTDATPLVIGLNELRVILEKVESCFPDFIILFHSYSCTKSDQSSNADDFKNQSLSEFALQLTWFQILLDNFNQKHNTSLKKAEFESISVFLRSIDGYTLSFNSHFEKIINEINNNRKRRRSRKKG